MGGKTQEKPATICRAIALPVSCAVDEADKHQPWKSVAEAIQAAWRNATDLANWGLGQCHLIEADTARKAKGPMGDGPCPKLALYTLGITEGGKRLYPRRREWEGQTQSASSVLRAVEAKWRKERRAALLYRTERVPCFRFPFPFPVNRQSWECGISPAGRMWVSVALPGGRVRLQLRGGPEFGRQAGIFRRVAAGELPSGELAIYRVRADNKRRIGCVDEKPAGGGNEVRYQTMVKIIYRDTPKAKKGRPMVLRRDPDCLWVAEVYDRQDFVLNEDFHRRLRERMTDIAHFASKVKERHGRRIHRLAEDYKLESRSGTPRVRRQELFARCADKYDRRMRTACQQAVAALVGFALRQGVARIFYNKEGCEGKYNWSTLDLMLKHKCEENGIKLGERPGGSKKPVTARGE